MFFLLRTAFWLTLVLAIVPLGSGEPSKVTEKVDPVSAFLAAQATVSDIGGFCSRNPRACETGGSALSAIGSQARDGARIVYEFLDGQMASPTSDESLMTGSTPSHQAVSSGQIFAGVPIDQPAFDKVSGQETVLGPVPRPKPRSGHKT